MFPGCASVIIQISEFLDTLSARTGLNFSHRLSPRLCVLCMRTAVRIVIWVFTIKLENIFHFSFDDDLYSFSVSFFLLAFRIGLVDFATNYCHFWVDRENWNRVACTNVCRSPNGQSHQQHSKKRKQANGDRTYVAHTIRTNQCHVQCQKRYECDGDGRCLLCCGSCQHCYLSLRTVCVHSSEFSFSCFSLSMCSCVVCVFWPVSGASM